VPSGSVSSVPLDWRGPTTNVLNGYWTPSLTVEGAAEPSVRRLDRLRQPRELRADGRAVFVLDLLGFARNHRRLVDRQAENQKAEREHRCSGNSNSPAVETSTHALYRREPAAYSRRWMTV